MTEDIILHDSNTFATLVILQSLVLKTCGKLARRPQSMSRPDPPPAERDGAKKALGNLRRAK